MLFRPVCFTHLLCNIGWSGSPSWLKECGQIISQGKEHQCLSPDASFLTICLSVCFFLCNRQNVECGVRCGRKKATALPNECFLQHVHIHSRAAGQGLNHSQSHISDPGSLSALTWSRRHFPSLFVCVRMLVKTHPLWQIMSQRKYRDFFFFNIPLVKLMRKTRSQNVIFNGKTIGGRLGKWKRGRMDWGKGKYNTRKRRKK